VVPRLICGLFTVLFTASFSQAQTLTEGSLWKNTKNSLLLITKIDTTKNIFGGTFVNYATGFPQCVGVGVPVSGEINGSDVKFVANFAPCSKTITVWKGTISGSTIATTYDLRYVDVNYDIQPDTGSDTFTKQ